MKQAFTLIEVLVVMAMLSILMMLIAPAGLQIVESVDGFIAKKNEEKEVDKLQFQAFLQAQDLNATQHPILKKFNIQTISSKGVLVKKDENFE